jgi:hypothetical protein
MIDTKDVPVKLASGDKNQAVIYVQARHEGGESEVAFGGVADFSRVTDGIRMVAKDVADALRDASPKKLSVEMGFEVKLDSGGLIALLAAGGATASITVTMEWEATTAPPT